MAEEGTKTKTKRKRNRPNKVMITGASVTVNGVIYGISAMETEYATSMSLPSKEKVMEVCAKCYMELLELFTNCPKKETNEMVIPERDLTSETDPQDRPLI